jgi:hypothetical protein
MWILTIVSVLAAIGFAWLAWRSRQEERRRSKARVAALSAAIDAVESASSDPPPRQAAVAVSSLFAPEPSAAAQGGPVIAVAVGVAMAVALIVVVAMSNRGTTAGAPAEIAPLAAQAPPAAAAQAAPLELISMRHERNGDAFKVSGLVRNPRRGGTMTRVTAVVFAFDRAGAFVASGSAGLDFTSIEPGDESPFVVTIPGVSDIGKYRVSFRTEAGVVRHVDRRAEQMRIAARLE